jgi:hypothetical protein
MDVNPYETPTLGEPPKELTLTQEGTKQLRNPYNDLLFCHICKSETEFTPFFNDPFGRMILMSLTIFTAGAAFLYQILCPMIPTRKGWYCTECGTWY